MSGHTATSDVRFVNCETCQTEGRILTNDGGPVDVDHGVCPACGGARVVEVDVDPVTLEDLEDVPFHPLKNLPGCMMPDGGDCCVGYTALADDWHKLSDSHAELVKALEEIASWRDNTLGVRPRPGGYVTEKEETFDRGARMAFYRCADRARTALAKATPSRDQVERSAS